MNVLHIGKFYPPCPGGMETYVRDLAEGQAGSGLRVAVLAHEHEPGRAGGRSMVNGVSVHRVRTQSRGLYAPISLGFGGALRRAIREHRPDLLHVHLPNASAAWLLLVGSAGRLPWVLHWHSDVVVSRIDRRVGWGYGLYRPVERRLLRRASAVIATSPPYLDASEALRPYRGKCRVIPLGLGERSVEATRGEEETAWAEARWSEAGASETGMVGGSRMGAGARRLRVLAVGRLAYYKGFDTLVRAVGLAPGVSACLVGSGPLESVLRERRSRAEVVDRLVMTGSVSDARRDALMGSGDVLVLPSIERTEAFGLVLLEAMRLARPCVVGDVAGSGMGWVVRHEREGLHFRAGDERALAAALERMASDDQLRRRLGEAGRSRFEREFRLGATLPVVRGLYDEVLSG